MILSSVMSEKQAGAAVAELTGPIRAEYVGTGPRTVAGKRVTPETSKQIATAYRCANIISDDIAAMPLQLYRRLGDRIEQVSPDPIVRNLAYLLEIRPNRWMIPLIFKKAIIDWLIWYGNAYIWNPVQAGGRELFILPADKVTPVFDADGAIWYETYFPSGKKDMIPAVEVAHLMINSSDGIRGRSVLTYARETLAGQLSAHETRNKISGGGLAPAAALWMNGEVNEEARKKARRSYVDNVVSQDTGPGVVVFDQKVAKFEAITIKPVDAQFLETTQATDGEIANFFGMPLNKLNMGKQSYQSNEQQDLDYLKTTLNPYLVQWEQVGRVKWLSLADQLFYYLHFNRDSILRTDSKSRTETLAKRIETGQLSPNEARALEDLSGYPGGDVRYVPANWTPVG